MAANINVTECNTLPVLYKINFSTVVSPQHQDYIIIYIYIYLSIYIYIHNMKPYSEQKMKI